MQLFASSTPPKPYDVVVYGATGFTGKLAAKYIARQYGGTSLKWAVGGRSRSKLEALARELNTNFVVADGDDEAALDAMTAQTKAVASCAGPFSKYGTKLVASCAKNGVGYCDITGESDWVREMIDAYDSLARDTGARIVHFCGHDCVPWDLSVLALHDKIKEKGDTLKTVDFFDEIKSQPSGGTLETAFGIMFGPAKKKKVFGFDPLLRKADGSKASAKTTIANPNLSLEKGDFKARSFFVMAGVNGNAVKRSNALLDYGNISYSEGLGFKSVLGAVGNVAALLCFGLLVAFPPTRYLTRKFLPKPGEGPTDEFMASGYLRVTGVATGHNGTTAKSLISFHVDPGYMDTARMVVEAALALALDADKLKHVKGGVYTPAACQGHVLLDRLCKTGTTFSCL